MFVCAGNLGSSLSYSSFNTRLYFSRDGGFTWAEVRTGQYEFQFAALGSVVVAVLKRWLVTYVVWTCDEGATWQTSRFVDSNFPRGIVVIGMRTEAGEKARHVTYVIYMLAINMDTCMYDTHSVLVHILRVILVCLMI